MESRKRKFALLLAAAVSASMGDSTEGRVQSDINRDLVVEFGSKRGTPEPGAIAGVVRNRSAQTYPCVRIEFRLATHFEARQAGEPARELGTVEVLVHDVRPRSATPYEKALPYKAGFGLKSVSPCQGEQSEGEPSEGEPSGGEPGEGEQGEPEPPPAPDAGRSPQPGPRRPSWCSITGHVTGPRRVTAAESRGRRPARRGRSTYVLTHVSIYTVDPRQLVQNVPLDARGRYVSRALRPGMTYLVTPAGARWDSEPRSETVSCPAVGTARRVVNFRIRRVMGEG